MPSNVFSILFLVATILNPLVMLNLLIAIMSDTYDRVQESVEVADGKELAEMVLEVEIFMFWNRKKQVYKYLQMCEEEDYDEGGDHWLGKVRELKRMMRKQSERQRLTNMKIEEVNTKVEELKKEVGSSRTY